MLRRATPVRTCAKKFSNYRLYKPHLQTDFNNRCGYCDVHDTVSRIPFHIDHFAPVKYFSELETEYSNLVYSCPSCNRAKWNYWPMTSSFPSHDGKRGFVDPCKVEYDEHLERKPDGCITAKTILGVYICGKLKLRLRKHRFLWLLDKVMEQCDKIQDFLESADENDSDTKELINKYNELLRHYQSYHRIIGNRACP